MIFACLDIMESKKFLMSNFLFYLDIYFIFVYLNVQSMQYEMTFKQVLKDFGHYDTHIFT